MTRNYKSRKKSEDEFETGIKIIFFGIAFLIKELIVVIELLSNSIIELSEKYEQRSKSANFTDIDQINKPTKATGIYSETNNNQEQKKIPNTNIKTLFDSAFQPQIRIRGLEYYNKNKVTNYTNIEKTIRATVGGSEEYRTQIELSNNNEFKNALCTCPYFKKENKYCKHIYALLITYCKNNNIYEKDNTIQDEKTLIFNNKILPVCKSMDSMIDYCVRIYPKFEKSDYIDSLLDNLLEYKSVISKYRHISKNRINNNLLKKLQDDYEEVESLYEEMSHELENEIGQKAKEQIEEPTIVSKASILSGAYLVYKALEHKSSKEEQQLLEEKEQLKKEWGLLDWEADLVQKGDYDPWNFSEPGEGEELEEDDYYYED